MDSFTLAIRYIPYIAADRAVQRNMRTEQEWANRILFRKDCHSVSCKVNEFLFNPWAHADRELIPGCSYSRLASKMIREGVALLPHSELVNRMHHSGTMAFNLRRNMKDYAIPETNWKDLTPWC